MSDPNLPEGVKQSDIDRAVGETFDPDLCEHFNVACDNCETTLEEIENYMKDAGVASHKLLQESELRIKNIQTRMENIKTLCDYLYKFHPPLCAGWFIYNKRIDFNSNYCDCYIGDILHEIEMAEDFL